MKLLYNQFNETTNKNPIKSPKLLSQRMRKPYYKTFGTSVINSQMAPPSLGQYTPKENFQFFFFNINLFVFLVCCFNTRYICLNQVDSVFAQFYTFYLLMYFLVWLRNRLDWNRF